MAKIGVSNSVTEAQRILTMWTANPAFGMGDITQEQFQAAVTALQNSDRAVEDTRTQLMALTNKRDDDQKVVDGYVTRARSSARGQFGPDSTQYEQAGGTRQSERKPAKRKPKPSGV